MTDFNFLKKISVKVNDSGSGVIVKPCTDEYCYVFTDWHVVKDKKLKDVKVEYYVLGKDEYGDVEWKFKEESPTYIYTIEDRDVAILVMPPDMAEHFVKIREMEEGKDLYHAGFPDSRRSADCDSQYISHHITELHDRLNKGLISYIYETELLYNDLAGTSGGGIFTNDCCLVGLHEGESIKNPNNLYSKSNLIPIKFFKKLIDNNRDKLEPIWLYKWDSFDPFIEKAFYIDKGALFQNTMMELSTKLNDLKKQCRNLSPKDIIKDLNIGDIAKKQFFSECFDDEDFGIYFLEYIVCMHILYEYPLTKEGVCKMVKHSMFVYWNNANDDFWQVIQSINSSCLNAEVYGDTIYVAGLKSNGYHCDIVTKGDKSICNIARPMMNVSEPGLNVGHPSKLEHNFINTCLFKDCIEHEINSFERLDGSQALTHYKEILEIRINGTN